MLPFDNKSEFQVILNMPEGLHAGADRRRRPRDGRRRPHRARGARLPGLRRHRLPSISTASCATTSCAAGQRRRSAGQPAAQGRAPRAEPRHRQARPPALAAIAAKYGAAVAVAEVPPGPPVLQTLVAEIYGPTRRRASSSPPRCANLPRHARRRGHRLVCRGEQPKTIFHVDKAKAALHGISEAAIARTVQMAVQGYPVDLLHAPARARGRGHRARAAARPARPARGPAGAARPLRSDEPAGAARAAARTRPSSTTVGERNIYHKNLMPVTYVTGDVAGVSRARSTPS
jgi:multidrug efflux pump subunit AcrB